MNVRNLLTASALAAAGLFAGAAQAAPADHDGIIKSASFLGPTGYIMTPNAYVQPRNTISLGTHFVAGPNRDLPDVALLHAGIGLFDYAEAGGADRIPIDSAVQEALYMHGKLKVTPSKFPLQIAGGVIDGTNALARNVYAVGTLDLMQAMGRRGIKRGGTVQSVQVGGGYRWQSGSGDFGVTAREEPFVNGAIQFGRTVQLMGEWNPGQEFRCNPFYPLDGSVNAGLRAQLGTPGLALDIAGIGLDGEDPTYGAGVNYTFGLGGRRGHGKKHKKDSAVPAATQTAQSVFGSRGSLGLASHLAR